jgi:hypothetical protein
MRLRDEIVKNKSLLFIVITFVSLISVLFLAMFTFTYVDANVTETEHPQNLLERSRMLAEEQKEAIWIKESMQDEYGVTAGFFLGTKQMVEFYDRLQEDRDLRNAFDFAKRQLPRVQLVIIDTRSFADANRIYINFADSTETICLHLCGRYPCEKEISKLEAEEL